MLSGYLDGALDTAMRSDLEDLLRDDSELGRRVRDQLNEMQALSQSLRQLSRRDAGVRLDSSFADRVLNEAVSRAREEGLSADHPLVRVAEQPMRALGTGGVAWHRKAIASVLAVAASIGLVAWSVSMRGDPEPGLDEVAMADSNSRDVAAPVEGPNLIEEPMERAAGLRVADSAKSVEVDGISDSADVVVVEPATEMIASQAVSPNQNEIMKPLGAINQQSTMGPPAVAPFDHSSFDRSSTVSVSPTVRSRPAAVIVLDVRQSDAGRDSDSVRRALAASEISSTNKHPVNRPIAEAATNAAGVASSERVSLMYLEASASKLDNFYLAMLQDSEGIESVSLSLAMDAPIMDSIEELRPEAETVAVTELDGNQEAVEGLVKRVDQLPFAPLNRDVAKALSLSDQSDVETAVLVIIR